MRMRLKEEGDTLLVRLIGEFDRAGVVGVEAALERLSAHTTRIVFDLRGLSFLDRGGLMTILKANAQANSERFEVIVVRPRGLARRVFTLTRAGEQLTLVDDIPPSSQPPSGCPSPHPSAALARDV